MSLFEEVVGQRFFLGTPSTVATTSLRVRGQAFILVAWCRPAPRSSLLRLLDSLRRLCCSTPLKGPLESAWCPSSGNTAQQHSRVRHRGSCSARASAGASRDDRLTVTMKPEAARAAFGPFGEQHQDTDAFFSAGATFICNLFFATGGAPATFATRCSQEV